MKGGGKIEIFFGRSVPLRDLIHYIVVSDLFRLTFREHVSGHRERVAKKGSGSSLKVGLSDSDDADCAKTAFPDPNFFAANYWK